MKNITLCGIFAFLSVSLFANGMSEEDLFCDLSSQNTLKIILEKDDVEYNEVHEILAEQLKGPEQSKGPVYREVSVCLVIESEVSVLGILRKRRDVVEIRYKSPAVEDREQRLSPNSRRIYSVRSFREIKAPLGKWHFSRYTPVKMVLIEESATIGEILNMDLLSPSNDLMYRIVAVDVTDQSGKNAQ